MVIKFCDDVEYCKMMYEHEAYEAKMLFVNVLVVLTKSKLKG